MFKNLAIPVVLILAIQGGISGINSSEWIKVLYGLVLSTILGFVLGFVVVKIIILICKKIERRKTNKFFKYGQIMGGAARHLCMVHKMGKNLWVFLC